MDLVKCSLKKVLAGVLITVDRLYISLVKLKAVLHFRPITSQLDEPREPKPIRPSDLLLGR